MKKTVFCVIFILASAVIWAGKITIGEITAMQFMERQNRMQEKKVIVQYDVKAKLTYVYFEDVMGDYAVVLNEKKKAELLGLISLYLKMEKEAKKQTPK